MDIRMRAQTAVPGPEKQHKEVQLISLQGDLDPNVATATFNISLKTEAAAGQILAGRDYIVSITEA